MTGIQEQKPNKQGSKFVGIVFLLIGLFTLFGGTYYGYESWNLTQNGEEVNGTVVDYHERIDNDQNSEYAPIIQYHVKNELFRFTSANYNYNPKYEIGAQLPLLVDPDTPEQARVYNFGEMWGLAIGLGIAGLFVVIASTGWLFRKR